MINVPVETRRLFDHRVFRVTVDHNHDSGAKLAQHLVKVREFTELPQAIQALVDGLVENVEEHGGTVAITLRLVAHCEECECVLREDEYSFCDGCRDRIDPGWNNGT